MKFKLSEVLFFLSYGMYLVVTILNTSMFAKYIAGTPITLIFILCVIILIVREGLFKIYTLKKFVGLLFFAFITLMMIWYSGIFTTVTLICLFVFCARNIDFKLIAKFTLVISSIVVGLIITSSFLGIIKNYTIVTNGRVRSYLGFRYALHAQTYVFNITALLLYIKQSKLKLYMGILLIGINYYFFTQTDSRLSFFMSCILIILALLTQYKPDYLPKAKTITKILCCSFIIATVISVCLAVFYNPGVHWMNELNSVLNNRLYFSNLSLKYYPISFFGHDTEFIGAGLDINGNRYVGQYFYVDCFYILIMEKYGLIIAVIIIALLTYSLVRCKNENEWLLFVILVLCAVHFLIDDLFLYLNYNTFWFLIDARLSSGLVKGSNKKAESNTLL